MYTDGIKRRGHIYTNAVHHSEEALNTADRMCEIVDSVGVYICLFISFK
jgi:hypothetical protein